MKKWKKFVRTAFFSVLWTIQSPVECAEFTRAAASWSIPLLVAVGGSLALRYGYTAWKQKHAVRYILADGQLTVPDIASEHPFIFVHGAFDSCKQVLQVVKGGSSNHAPYVTESALTFDFDDSFAHSCLPLWTLSGCLAQKFDVEKLRAYVEKVCNVYTHSKSLILYGISRGASTIINYSGIYGMSAVGACILESPYYDAEEIITYRLSYLGLPLWLKSLVIKMVAGRYNPQDIQPKDMIKMLQDDVPTLIIALENDKVVPLESSLKVYEAMRANGATRVHLLVLKEGRHGWLISGSEGSRLQDVVHAFFKHYDLPHDATCAERGKAEFFRMLE